MLFRSEFVNHIEYWHLYKNLLDKAVMAVQVVSSDNNISVIPECHEVPKMDNKEDQIKVAEMVKKLMDIDATVKDVVAQDRPLKTPHGEVYHGLKDYAFQMAVKKRRAELGLSDEKPEQKNKGNNGVQVEKLILR